MSAPWITALQAAHPTLGDTLYAASEMSQWGHEAYWDSLADGEGETRLEAQAHVAVQVYDAMVRHSEKLVIPEALRVYIPHARQVVSAWKAYDDADDGTDEKETASKARAKLAGDTKPERRPWPGRPAAPALPASAPAKKRERFWLHNKVFEVPLTPYAFRVYCYLARRAGKTGICWPGQDTIVRECQMDPKTVTRALLTLRRARMIAMKRGAFGRASKYRLTDPDLWRITTPSDGAVTEAH